MTLIFILEFFLGLCDCASASASASGGVKVENKGSKEEEYQMRSFVGNRVGHDEYQIKVKLWTPGSRMKSDSMDSMGEMKSKPWQAKYYYLNENFGLIETKESNLEEEKTSPFYLFNDTISEDVKFIKIDLREGRVEDNIKIEKVPLPLPLHTIYMKLVKYSDPSEQPMGQNYYDQILGCGKIVEKERKEIESVIDLGKEKKKEKTKKKGLLGLKFYGLVVGIIGVGVGVGVGFGVIIAVWQIIKKKKGIEGRD
jgi:hypothetical protein